MTHFTRRNMMVAGGAALSLPQAAVALSSASASALVEGDFRFDEVQ